jgi:hypothetical protein
MAKKAPKKGKKPAPKKSNPKVVTTPAPSPVGVQGVLFPMNPNPGKS